jgi:4-amino-4-deoxy-L-arabinose transferase-like glycosyltransferase
MKNPSQISLALLICKPLFWVMLLALVLRVGMALYLGNVVSGLSGAQDEVSYSMLGQRLVEGHGLTFPTGWYPWYYPDAQQSYYSVSMSLFLAAIYFVFGYQPLVARLIMALISMVVVWEVVLLARCMFGEKVAIVSGLIAAGYAYLIFYGATLLTETPFIALLLATLLMVYRVKEHPTARGWMLLGAFAALMVLFRMASLFLVPFLLLWIVIKQPRQVWRALIPIAIIGLAISPFTIRNYILWNRFLLLEAQFGHVFWNGNHPDAHGNFHPWIIFKIPRGVLASRNDVDMTSQLLKMGIENVLTDPGNFAMLTLTRLREFFKFWPSSDSNLMNNILRVVSFGIMWPFSLAGLVLSRKEWRTLLPLYLFMIIHTGIYAITWTMIRYRIPLDAVLIPFASLAGVAIWARLKPVLPRA